VSPRSACECFGACSGVDSKTQERGESPSPTALFEEIKRVSVIEHAFYRLCSGVDPKTQELKKGKPNVVMFVGLQARLSGFGLHLTTRSVRLPAHSPSCIWQLVLSPALLEFFFSSTPSQDDDVHQVRIPLQAKRL